MKTYRFLKSENIPAPAILKRIEKHSTDEILRSIHNPDHSASAKEVLKAVSKERGVDDSSIDAFRISSNELQVQSFGKPPSLQEALRRPHRWRCIYRSIQWVSLLLLAGMFYCISLEEGANQRGVDALVSGGVVDSVEYQKLRKESSDVDGLNKAILKNFSKGESSDYETIGQVLGGILFIVFFPHEDSVMAVARSNFTFTTFWH